ncbi:MAG: FAD-binding oxidoreductase, partial [Ancalomicrobiaceae bacterium]|nr:FAD-binding oxidoreductase [Ancalomicrobiaceae bacterium]
AAGDHPRPRLQGERTVDVCVIGAGYTGLSAALHLARNGRSVAVVEARRIGWGASGRNGGQLHSGQRLGQEALESRLGEAEARALFELAEEAKRQVKDAIRDHAIDCDWHDGLIHTVHKRRLIAHAQREIDHLAERYAYQGMTWLERGDLAAAIGTDRYVCGWRDASAGHLHPLNFALGLARAAEEAGVVIYEGTRVLAIGEASPCVVRTDGGTIRASDVIIAVNGYGSGLAPSFEARIMPINNYLIATEPLGDRLDALIPGREAVADSRFVVHYWRPTGDGRLIFGGGETYRTGYPPDLPGFVRPHLLDVYPGLKDVRLDYAWGGTLALSMSMLPVMPRLRPGLYAAGGYTGHGVAIANLAGKLMAEAILGDTSRFDVFARIPARPFPGGRAGRFPLLVLAMLWYGLLDRL